MPNLRETTAGNFVKERIRREIVGIGDAVAHSITLEEDGFIESSNFVTGVSGFRIDWDGDAEFEDVIIRGEANVVFKEVSAVGGEILVLPADVLDVDMTALDASTLTIRGDTSFAVGDILRISFGGDEEWLEVTNIGSAPTYTVTRDLDGSYGVDANPVWKAGTAVVNYMLTGDGGLKFLSGPTPTFTIFTHAGAPYTTITDHVRFTPELSQFGADVDVVGSTSMSIFHVDQTYDTESMGAGDVLWGDHGNANMLWDASTGQLQFRGGTTIEAYVGTDGMIYAGGGDIILSSDGLSLWAGDDSPALKGRVAWFNDSDLKIGQAYIYHATVSDTLNFVMGLVATPTKALRSKIEFKLETYDTDENYHQMVPTFWMESPGNTADPLIDFYYSFPNPKDGNAILNMNSTIIEFNVTQADVDLRMSGANIADVLKLDAGLDMIQFGNYVMFQQVTAPGAPAGSGWGNLYYKTGDDGLFWHPFGGSEVDLTASAGGGAPTTAQYVVITLDGALSAERRLQVDDNTLQLTDAGANNDITISVDATMVWDNTDVTLQTTTSGHIYLNPFGNIYLETGYVQANSPSGGLVVFIANQTGTNHYGGYRIDRDGVETWFTGISTTSDNYQWGYSASGNLLELTTAGGLEFQQASTISTSTGDLTLSTAGDDIWLQPSAGNILDINLDTDRTSSWIGRLVFGGHNLSAANIEYAYVVGRVLDATAGSEDGAIDFYVYDGGAPVLPFRISGGNDGVTILDIFNEQNTATAEINRITFSGKNSTPQTHAYASIRIKIVDPTVTAEDGEMQFLVHEAGVDTYFLSLVGGGDILAYKDLTFNQASTISTTTGDLILDPSGNMIVTLGGDVATFEVPTTTASSIILRSERTAGATGYLYFQGHDTIAADVNYAYILGAVDSATDGAEYGSLQFYTMSDGVEARSLYLSGGNTIQTLLTLYNTQDQANDLISQLSFYAKDSGAANQAYADILAYIADPTATEEDGRMDLRVTIAGALDTKIRLDATAMYFYDDITFPQAATISTSTGDLTLDATGNLVVSGITGIDFAPGSDVDFDIITLGVTGAPRLSWDQSDDAFDISKNLDIAGHLAIGSAGTIDAAKASNLLETFTDPAAAGYGTYSRAHYTLTANNANDVYAIYGSASVNIGIYDVTGSAVGVFGYGLYQAGTGTVSNLVGGKFYVQSIADGDITDAAAIFIQSGSQGGSGAMDHLYGIYIQSQAAGDINYSIYTNAGTLSFGDDLVFRQESTISTDAGDLILAPASGWTVSNAYRVSDVAPQIRFFETDAADDPDDYFYLLYGANTFNLWWRDDSGAAWIKFFDLDGAGSIKTYQDIDFQQASTISTSTGELNLSPAGDILLTPTGNDVWIIPSTGQVVDLHFLTDINSGGFARLQFWGHNSTPADYLYGHIQSRILDNTAGAEYASIDLYISGNGTMTQAFLFESGQDAGATKINFYNQQDQADDLIAEINFMAHDSGAADTTYAKILVDIEDPTSPNEDGRLDLVTTIANANTIRIRLDSAAIKFYDDLLFQQASVIGSSTGDLTINPSGDLYLDDSSSMYIDAYLYFRNTNDATDFLQIATSSTGFSHTISGNFNSVETGYIQFQSDGDLVMQADTAHKFVVAAATVVTIGTGVQVGAPTSGDMGAGTINVDTDLYKDGTVYDDPDYVLEHYYNGAISLFEDNPGASEYDGIRPIDVTAEFMKINLHLPWIGRDVSGIFERGNMLLVGQETMMLHIIELKREVEELKAQIRKEQQ